ncbi:MAG TPA: c-type cytochrome [Halothiobacillaceae bacterium]|nr:c-type cytochrome [Halothiobacillaceae bacterium]
MNILAFTHPVPILIVSLASLALVPATAAGDESAGRAVFSTKAELGQALFHDPILSRDRTQSCATCHEPGKGFVDGRRDEDGRVRPVSLGDDGHTLGERNAPTLTYAALTPAFQPDGERKRVNKQKSHQRYHGPLGGQFLDGRAATLAEQAGGPPINPDEMNLPDKAAVVERLEENAAYVASFKALFGEDVLRSAESGYRAMTESIAAFERTDRFATFDSKYDRALAGEATLSFKESTGKSLFFSQFANCAICHQLHGNGDPIKKFEEPFTGYEFHNIGVPANPALDRAEPDPGLYGHPAIDDPGARGKFKVPTLRNVAVTGPYMHNGVFRDLETVIEFYDHFVNDERTVNPETGEPWREPEVPATVADDLLAVGDPMSDYQVEAMVCFLRTLTDRRYEDQLPEDTLGCDQ